jgi:hypothetical protein
MLLFRYQELFRGDDNEDRFAALHHSGQNQVDDVAVTCIQPCVTLILFSLPPTSEMPSRISPVQPLDTPD